MKDMREAFEAVCAPNFSVGDLDLSMNGFGEYTNPTLEDHWQTFQEGWECAIEHLKNRGRERLYSDVVSDGGLDPRDRAIPKLQPRKFPENEE